MVKEHHIKRIAAPRNWQILRKENKFITRQNTGGHKESMSLALNTIIRDLIKAANNTKEVKHIAKNKNIKVNGKITTDNRCSAGLFDVISLTATGKHYRITLNLSLIHI